MNAPNRDYHSYTEEEYLGLLKSSDRRFEYWDGEIVDMSGGTWNHGVIAANLVIALDRKTRAGCKVLTGEMAIRPPGMRFFIFPDASVVCGKPQLGSVDGIEVLLNPIVVAEVLSPNTEHRDRNEKRKAYQSIPSLLEYLLIDQGAANLVRYTKTGDLWRQDGVSGIDECIALPSIQTTLRLSDLYDGAIFD